MNCPGKQAHRVALNAARAIGEVLHRYTATVSIPWRKLSRRIESVAPRAIALLWLATGVMMTMNVSTAAEDTTPLDTTPLDAVRAYADLVLEHGRDRYGVDRTPLFADGIEVDTREPAVWKYRGETWVLSNFANQQNLLRMLVGLSALTDEPRYRDAAVATTTHMFKHHQHEAGLLYWGGHQFIDLRTGKNHGLDVSCHEFKNTFPFYEFLWDVDAAATGRFLHAFWHAHVIDWRTLDMNRHGNYSRLPASRWQEPTHAMPPFFEGSGLTFINAGTDLILAGAMLHLFGGDDEPLTWSLHLAERYVKARHPKTGLGTYQYSKPTREQQPPAEGPLAGQFTWSRYGDRAENQFGGTYGEVAREGWALLDARPRTIYVANALVQLHLAEQLGDRGKDLRDWTVAGLKAYHQHAYDRKGNRFRPMWADGTDLTGKTIERTGYYGPAGKAFTDTPADGEFLLAYARAYRLSGDEALWQATRQIAAGLGLGELGETPGSGTMLNADTTVSDFAVIFALLDIARATDEPDLYLSLADRVAANLLRTHLHKGYFVSSAKHRYVKFDTPMPLALLALEAQRRGRPELVPTYIGSRGYVHGNYDGHPTRTNDTRALWSQTRE